MFRPLNVHNEASPPCSLLQRAEDSVGTTPNDAATGADWTVIAFWVRLIEPVERHREQASERASDQDSG